MPQLAAFAKRYRDRKPDLADLCLIRMSELHPKHSLFTVDKDFRVYRRNKREVIPVSARNLLTTFRRAGGVTADRSAKGN